MRFAASSQSFRSIDTKPWIVGFEKLNDKRLRSSFLRMHRHGERKQQRGDDLPSSTMHHGRIDYHVRPRRCRLRLCSRSRLYRRSISRLSRSDSL